MKHTFTILSLIAFSLILMSNRSGRTSLSGAPSTGAPGENGQTCGSFGCHASGAFDPTVTLTMLDEAGSIVDSYKPGQNYTINMLVETTGTPAGFGFQMVSLKDSDDTGINTFSNFPDRVKDVTALGRQYVEQSNILQTNEINLTWTAPESGSGDVTFYAIGNAINANGNSGGDGVGTTQKGFAEDTSSSNLDLQEQSVKLFPNPVSNILNLETPNGTQSTEIYNLNGQLLLESYSKQIDVSSLNTGLLIIKVLDLDNKAHISRVYKN